METGSSFKCKELHFDRLSFSAKEKDKKLYICDSQRFTVIGHFIAEYTWKLLFGIVKRKRRKFLKNCLLRLRSTFFEKYWVYAFFLIN